MMIFNGTRRCYPGAKNIFRSLYQNLSHLPQNEMVKPQISSNSPDSLLMNIKSSTNFFELCDTISPKRKDLNAEHVMQMLKTLFSLQKNVNTAMQSSDIMKNPNFRHLCRSLRKNATSMELNDVIEALKILSFIGVPLNSEIGLTLLNLIKYQINDLTLGHIVFLDFLLKKIVSTPLVEALKLALPMLLQIQLGTKMDHENVAQLTDLLLFTTRNQVSEQCVTNVVSALTLHGEDLSCEQAQSIIWSLCDMKSFHRIYEKLMQNCINVFMKSMNELTFEAIETTITKMIDKYAQKFPEFYNENLFNKSAEFLVDNNVSFMNAIYLQRKFTKISFINIKLLNYISEKVVSEPDLLLDARPTVLFTLVSGLSSANHKPTGLNQIETSILQHPLLLSNKNDLPWIKFSLELMSLDIFHRRLLDKIFSSDFLEIYLVKDRNALDYLQLLALYQCTKIFWPNYKCHLSQQIVDRAIQLNLTKPDSQIKECVEYAFGGKYYVFNRISTNLGHYIDHVLVFNENGNAIACEDCNAYRIGAKFEDINVTDNNKSIAILLLPPTYYGLNLPRIKGIFDLRIRTLEAMGIKVVAINYQLWSNLQDREKIPFIEREVRHRLL